MMHTYDEYISFGGNCETSFQFRRYGKEPSSLFSWLATDIDKIIHVITEDFQDFYLFEALVPYTHNMVKSKVHGLCFHTAMLSKKSTLLKKLEFSASETDRKILFENEKNKYAYLIKKWKTLTSSSKKVLYFLKNKNYTQEKVEELAVFLHNKYPSHRFKLLWIKEGKSFEKQEISPYIDLVYVRLFSDIHFSWASDLYSWKKIFETYPIQNIPTQIDQKVLSRTINHLQTTPSRKEYSFQFNFNIAQFFEELGFMKQAKYFITEAKRQSSKKFVEDEYLRIWHKIEAIKEKEESVSTLHLQKLYSLDSKEEIESYINANKLLIWKFDNKPFIININHEIRYVRLSLQENQCFHLDEIEVWNMQGENIALDKFLMLSSTYKLEKPMLNKKATNGIKRGDASFHTKTENNPWVVLDLQEYARVQSIILFNREGSYAERALSLLVETSHDLKEWEIVYDNYHVFKNLKKDLLSRGQQSIFDALKKPTQIAKSEEILTSLQSLLALEKKDVFSAKLIKYSLLLTFKSYYQIKIDIESCHTLTEEIEIVNQAVSLCYTEPHIFTVKKGLQKSNTMPHTLTMSPLHIQIKVFLKSLATLDTQSDIFHIIKYATLSKYKAISRLNKELATAIDKDKTNALIAKGIALVYTKGHILTQHGITKSIHTRYNDQSKVKIVSAINGLFDLLKEKMDIEGYLVSGTLLGAVRDQAFISHDDDFDVAYISNESLYPNIWLETLQIVHILPFKVNPIFAGLLHIKIDLDVRFKLDLFTGWFENGYLHRFPIPPKILKESDLKPFQKIDLYGEAIQVPFNVKAVLQNNYGKNWETPDATWRFDWAKAKEDYKDCLVSLKEKGPSKKKIAHDIPFLEKGSKIDKLLANKEILDIDNDTTMARIKETMIVSLSSKIETEIYQQLQTIAQSKSYKIVILKYYFKESTQHETFVKFAKENAKYKIRYLAQYKTALQTKSICLEFHKDLQDA